MPSSSNFGGSWTRDKLDRVEQYLKAYLNVLKNTRLRKVYIDAFAGTGYGSIGPREVGDEQLFEEFSQGDTKAFVEGSVVRALRLPVQFDEYVLIEKDKDRFPKLLALKQNFPELAERIVTINGDCNEVLLDRLGRWGRYDRGVIFLDPYGMQVKWDTIRGISATKSIDLWILFPLGVAVNRLLRRDGNIDEGWRQRLNLIFGSEHWYDEFYSEHHEDDLFGNGKEYRTKVVDLAGIASYYNDRLRTIFPAVAKNPLKLFNSRANPLYLLCFVCANPDPRAYSKALSIAEHILGKGQS